MAMVSIRTEAKGGVVFAVALASLGLVSTRADASLYGSTGWMPSSANLG